MKRAGIIGGIAPESTIEYYRAIITLYRQKQTDGSFPQIIINSIDMKRMLDLVGADRIADLVAYLLAEIHRLADAGADFGILASNTPHMVFDPLVRQSSLPLISIVEATCREAQKQGRERLGLFGTRFTMQAGFYQDALERSGIETILPSSEEQDYIHEKYMTELVNGIFLPETREGLLLIARRLKQEEDIDGLILGGTELPMILRNNEDADIPFLDTTMIHAASVVSRLLE